MSELNGGPPAKTTLGAKFRQLTTNATDAIDNANEASKRMEETANWVAITLACVSVVSVVALGVAVIALIGRKGCDCNEQQADG